VVTAADELSEFVQRRSNTGERSWLTRGATLRALGFVDAVAFYSLARQLDGLIGHDGLLPATRFLANVREFRGGAALFDVPSIFWISASDATLHAAAYAGLSLSIAAVLGYASAPVMAGIWLLYSSFVHVGQVFYGYGWELLMIEAGFLAIFLAPPWYPRSASPPAGAVIWLFRWLTFRVMFGAGLIKLRGDHCWIALTCLADHYETQPNPGPLSWYFHALPLAAHKAGALFNHLVELVAPFGLFGPRRVRHVAGALIVAFQVTLILSGNLSFLNWLTIAVTLPAFDDDFFVALLPARFRARVESQLDAARAGAKQSTARRRVIVGLCVIVGALSIFPVVNMISPDQAMNASFDPFSLVNTYGAFGSVEHERHEVVIEGTQDDPLEGPARWREYEFPCKPGDVKRRPCWITPYHSRLDWQMWFAGLSDFRRQPWILKLAYELLRENPAVTSLLATDPFAGHPPRYVRALLYRYRFSPRPGQAWWERELIGEYLRPLSLDDPELHAFLARRRWLPVED
jgi:hypothetical protein